MFSYISSLFFAKSKEKPPFAARHQKLFPDVYRHPGHAPAPANAREMSRRFNWLSSLYPEYSNDRLNAMVDAGFRAEIRAGLSLAVDDPHFSRITLQGPHPKEYLGRLEDRGFISTTSQVDLADAFHAYGYTLDWTGVMFGMETDTAGYTDALDVDMSPTFVCHQSRSFRQFCDEEVVRELSRFSAFLRIKVFEQALRHRKSRQHNYRENLISISGQVNRGEDVTHLSRPWLEINEVSVASLGVIDIDRPILVLARDHCHKFPISDPQKGFKLVDLTDDTKSFLAEYCDAQDIVADHTSPLPPNDPSWISVMEELASHTNNNNSDASSDLDNLPPADVALTLVFEFLDYGPAARTRLLKHVTLWSSEEEGAGSLLKMAKVVEKKHDLVAFIAFLCDKKNTSSD